MQPVPPASDSPPGGPEDSFGSNEAVLCAVNARPQASGSGLRIGFAVFDPRRPSLRVAELSCDAHLTSLEAVLMQVRSHTPTKHAELLRGLEAALGESSRATGWSSPEGRDRLLRKICSLSAANTFDHISSSARCF